MTARLALVPAPPSGLLERFDRRPCEELAGGRELIFEAIRPTVERIAAEHATTVELVLSPARSPANITAARDHAIAVVRWSSGLSTPSIGALFDRDHTSVVAAIARHFRRLNAGEP